MSDSDWYRVAGTLHAIAPCRVRLTYGHRGTSVGDLTSRIVREQPDPCLDGIGGLSWDAVTMIETKVGARFVPLPALQTRIGAEPEPVKPPAPFVKHEAQHLFQAPQTIRGQMTL